MIYLTLLLVLLPGMGWGMDFESSTIYPDGSSNVCSVVEGKLECLSIPSSYKKRDESCLAKMEAAMRAMEPFLSQTYRLLRQTLHKEDPRFIAVMKRWQAVKKECWRGP